MTSSTAAKAKDVHSANTGAAALDRTHRASRKCSPPLPPPLETAVALEDVHL